MRIVTITKECDRCGRDDNKAAEMGDKIVSVQLTTGATELEADLCSGCLTDITFGFREKSKTCNTCSRSYGTERGLSAHQTRTGHS